MSHLIHDTVATKPYFGMALITTLRPVFAFYSYKELETIRRHMDSLKCLMDKGHGRDIMEAFQAKSLEKPRSRLDHNLNNRPQVYRRVHKVSSKTLAGVEELKQVIFYLSSSICLIRKRPTT